MPRGDSESQEILQYQVVRMTIIIATTMKMKGTRSQHFPNNNKCQETTWDERLRIITLRDEARMKWKDIAALVNIKLSTCHDIYARSKVDNIPTNKHRTGRPPIFDKAEKEKLCLFITQDKRTQRLGWENLLTELGYACLVRTLRNIWCYGEESSITG
ncbi:hypothetical protein L873DRAFT_1840796 [Choiromyces venosus 120613-1]|uniref:Uncharacterized protein n=1 Tax=Choiromyces venosus 120613-1 TaxID=1336337 RepID=A0A3N4K026_9PEZI|nr:hypothetical protein L873DRAFT_1840796 [Choiromyces venosus 120613-1]